MLRLVTITSQPTGGPAYNVFHFDGTVQVDAQQAADALQNFWTSLATQLTNSAAVTLDPTVTVIDSLTGEPTASFSVTPWTVNGTWGNARSPAGVALLAQWRTGVYSGGREIRGRSFISGLGDVAEGSDTVPPTTTATVQGAIDALVTTGLLLVYSPTKAVAADVNGGAVWNKFALIRSRRD